MPYQTCIALSVLPRSLRFMWIVEELQETQKKVHNLHFYCDDENAYKQSAAQMKANKLNRNLSYRCYEDMGYGIV